MEEPRKRWSDQERKKMAVKMGGGGGIGAVVLMGGVLATAALASAFIVRKKGRSSGKDGSRRRRQSQDSPSEINEQNKEDEEKKRDQFVFVDQPSHVHKHLSDGETKEVEEDDDTGPMVSTESSKLDEKPRVEINGDVYDAEASEQILCSISPKKLEKDAISDGFVIIGDEKLPFEAQIQLIKEDVSNEISQESKNIDEVDVEEERAEREPSDDGEINGNTEACYDQEEIEVTGEENAVQEVFEEKNVNGDEEEGTLVTEIVEIIQEDEAVEGSHGDVVEYIEIEEQEKCDGTDEGIVTEKGEEEGWRGEGGDQSNSQSNLQTETGEKKINSENKEDGARIGDPAPENGRLGVPVLEEEVISHEEIEVKEYGADVDKIVERMEVNEVENSMVAAIVKVEEEKIPIVSESLEVKEDNCQPKDEEVAEYLEMNEEKIPIVAESLEVKEDNCQPKYKEDDFSTNFAKGVEEELISREDIAITEELKENVVLTESAYNCQPKDHESDIERNGAKQVEEDLFAPENIEAMKEDSATEEVAESVEVQENTSVQQQENGVERKELEDLSRTINAGIAKAGDDMNAGIAKAGDDMNAGIAKAGDDMIMEASEDDEKGENSKDFGDEANLFDEIEESYGDSSTESNSEAIWPAESLQETSSLEPQKKLIDQEVGGKIQEDKTVKESEHNSEDSLSEPYQVKTEESDSQKISAAQPTEADDSQFPYKNGNSGKTFVKKYAVNSTRWRVLIGTLSVVSSLSCSWFFGLSFVKLCLIVFLTMALSKIHGY